MRPDVAAWLERARADAEARGLAALVPLLESLAKSTSALRDADPALTGAAGCEGPISTTGASGGPDARDAAE